MRQNFYAELKQRILKKNRINYKVTKLLGKTTVG